MGSIARYSCTPLPFFLIRRSHSIDFTRAQGIPTYKIGLGGVLTRGCMCVFSLAGVLLGVRGPGAGAGQPAGGCCPGVPSPLTPLLPPHHAPRLRGKCKQVCWALC